MKLYRSLVSLWLAFVLLCAPAAASQSTLIMPTVGPMSMSTFVSTHLNPALAALGSCNSGATAPAAPFEGKCWLDTTTSTLFIKKIYDGADWIEQGRIATAANNWRPTIAGRSITTVSGTGGVAAMYETGPWTPVLTFTTPGDLSVAYSTQVGNYTRIGNQITATFSIQTSTFTHTTASGTLAINGLPLPSQNVANDFSYGALQWRGITKVNFTQVAARVDPNTSAVRFIANGSGQTPALIAPADMPTAGTVQLIGSITYTAAP